MERIEKQMQFILEIDKEKQIKRKTLQSNDNVNIKFTKMDRLIFTNLDRII